jgi:hypothetical protein
LATTTFFILDFRKESPMRGSKGAEAHYSPLQEMAVSSARKLVVCPEGRPEISQISAASAKMQRR